MELKKSKLKDDVFFDNFYKLIIDSYDYIGNFLIFIFYDVYDVLIKIIDNLKLDEFEEVYEYVLCVICLVLFFKLVFGYFEDENWIGVCIRDWIVGFFDFGFVFLVFIDCSIDIYLVMYYIKNVKDLYLEFMEEVLGCSLK